MKVLVLGATGRTGRHLMPLLAARGAEVVTLGRTATGRGLVGDPGDPAAMARALDGVEAVLSALGSTAKAPVCRRASAVVARAGRPGLRHIVVAGAAVDAPGDAKGLPDKIAGGLMRLFAGAMLAERQAELADLMASGLGWTMLRPPRLTDGAATGAWKVTFDRPHRIQIARADLAAAMVAALDRPDLIGRAPFVSAA
jgi:uncharacterized protein YbjT (DUF2867 family)